MTISWSTKAPVTKMKTRDADRILHPERAGPQEREHREPAGEARVACMCEVVLRAFGRRRDVDPRRGQIHRRERLARWCKTVCSRCFDSAGRRASPDWHVEVFLEIDARHVRLCGEHPHDAVRLADGCRLARVGGQREAHGNRRIEPAEPDLTLGHDVFLAPDDVFAGVTVVAGAARDPIEARQLERDASRVQVIQPGVDRSEQLTAERGRAHLESRRPEAAPSQCRDHRPRQQADSDDWKEKPDCREVIAFVIPAG